MGSVIDHVDCPNCGNPEAYDEFYYKTGEEMVNCLKCGYYRSSFIVRDKETGKAVKIDENKPFSADNVQWDDVHIEHPYGVLRITPKDSDNGISQVSNIGSEEEYNTIINEISDEDKANFNFRLNRYVNEEFTEQELFI